jgi:hypothetical protein
MDDLLVTLNDGCEMKNGKWYGTLSSDGEGEEWIGAAYRTDGKWDRKMTRVFLLLGPFDTEKEALDRAHAFPRDVTAIPDNVP